MGPRWSTVACSLELQLVDVRTRHFVDLREPDPRIVIMQIEESDIDWVRRTLGDPWPWPLTYNAHLVRVLDEAGAAALMVDILHLDRGAAERGGTFSQPVAPTRFAYLTPRCRRNGAYWSMGPREARQLTMPATRTQTKLAPWVTSRPAERPTKR